MTAVNLTHILEKTAHQHPDERALLFKDKSLTWHQYLMHAQQLGGALKAFGLQAGDRVAALSFNSDRLAELFYGPFYANTIFVPLNFRLSSNELLTCMQDCTPRLLFVGDGFVDTAREIAQACESCEHLVYMGEGELPAGFLDYEAVLSAATPAPRCDSGGDDVAVLFYTGGTTGKPKGVMLTHDNLFINAIAAISAYRFESGGQFLQVAPIFHAAAGSRMYSLAMASCCAVLLDKFDPQETAALIEKEKITDGLFVPTMLNMMLNADSFENYDLTSLKRISYGAAPMPEALIRQVIARLPHVTFFQGYGMTEAAPMVTILSPEAHELGGPLADKLSSVGKPVPHCDLRIVDEEGNDLPALATGELVVRGPNFLKGYWGLPEITSEVLRDGWYHTGDAGYIDEDGFVFLVDRIKDMIISGGENIYSAEVESAIYEHPAIRECAVIGIPHEKWGEAVHAIVTLKAGQTIDSNQLIDFCRERIARYKVPRSLEVIDEMPLSGASKILKTELRKPYWEK